MMPSNRFVLMMLVSLLLLQDALRGQPATQPTTQPTQGFLGATAFLSGSDGRQYLTGKAIVRGVYAGSPAEAGGLRSGDVIRSVDETQMQTLDDLLKFMRTTKPGQVISLTVTRGEETTQLKIKLGPYPEKMRPPSTQPE